MRGNTSACVGRIGDGVDTSEVLIRRSGVLDGEEDALDPEEASADTDEEYVDKAGEDEARITGEDDPVKTGEDTFDKTGSEDVFDIADEEADGFNIDPVSPLFAKVCGTWSRITSDGSGVSPPRTTRFALPNMSDEETGRFSDLLSGGNPCVEKDGIDDFPTTEATLGTASEKSCRSSLAGGEESKMTH